MHTVYKSTSDPAGDDRGRFVINNETGEVRLTRAVEDRRLMPNFTLNIMVTSPLSVYSKQSVNNNETPYLLLSTPQVFQVDDRLKYSVTSVLVRVLCDNKFPPVFNRTTFKGFIIQSSSPASIVSTYGNQVLQVQVSDQDFSDVRTHTTLALLPLTLQLWIVTVIHSQGLNPNIHYSLHPPSGLYQITQRGVLIARTDQLHAFDRHILQVG